ncbi:hypothetical protein D910_07259 [Dendroctonus ponderosae]|uniref:Uncharacterized protein n=2 Tax=Dendroctonus ponderosae TaxID=77166 RepID=U4UIY6_DENPD|nr:hypothetical protein D910_07259 [Dendroctonus ponderosae]KAH1006456.1 hypothetical protein HUJ05_007191 [Dendroctonus ponderosae]
MLALVMVLLMLQKMYLPANQLKDNLVQKVTDDLKFSNPGYLHYYIRIPVLILCGCFALGCGNLAAFISGLFAWKRWYVDQNITYFFLSCIASTVTSALSILINVVTYSNLEFTYLDDQDQEAPRTLSPLSASLAANAMLLAVLSVVWSLLATKLAYRGMTSYYPEDAMESGRNVAVQPKKGRALQNSIPIEIVNRFAAESMAGILPKKENCDLPKQETTVEYQQRVNKFLSASGTKEGEASANHVSPTDR